MTGLFMSILNMSLSAGIVALIVMLVRLVIRKAPKIYAYALWAVVFFRLVCPFTIELPENDIPVQLQTIPQDIVYYEAPSGEFLQNTQPTVSDNVSSVTEIPASETNSSSSVNSKNAAEIGLMTAAYVWLAGAIALMLYGVISYWRLKKRVETAIRVRDNIYETDRIETPFVLGFIRPNIYIPTGLDNQEVEYVIRHEQIHIRRLDYMIKPIAFIITAIHWFNPIIWVSYALLSMDIELSADEGVMKELDYDFKIGYSISLLVLSVKKSRILSPLAFGETGVRKRVKNVLNYKKPTFWVSMAAIFIVVISGIYLVSGNKPLAANTETGSNGVSIKYPSDFYGNESGMFETTDPKIVMYINSVIESSNTQSEPEDLINNNTNQYEIETYDESSRYYYKLYYNTLDNLAYLERDGGFVEVGTDFARYITSLYANNIVSTDIDENTASLFEEYGWTLDYQITTLDIKLNNIDVLSAFDPNAYYFAYNNELSKDIGLDMSGYSNKDIEVERYWIRESLPQEFYPYQSCMGIVVKNDDGIIGAFISAGFNYNACSLKGNSFEAVTGKTVNEWLADVVKADSNEEYFSKLEPEQVIEEYFLTLDQKDTKTAEYCLSKNCLMSISTINLLNDKLYSEEITLPFMYNDLTSDNIELKSAKLISVEFFDDPETTMTRKRFSITVDLQYDDDDQSVINGEQIWLGYMVYESPQTGWKIDSFGTG